jgi:hypothetical protein
MDPNVRSAQGELERLLGVRVRIKDRKGKGKIVIEYHTVDDYERVVGMLKRQWSGASFRSRRLGDNLSIWAMDAVAGKSARPTQATLG